MSYIGRIGEDYFKKSRLPDYKKTLERAKEHGYRMVGVLDFARMVRAGEIEGQKIYLNRHDIDTSPKVAAEMFAIEKEVYGKSATVSYYFRETTIDKKLIKELDEYGYETGYHYEQLATYAKKHKLKSREAIEKSVEKAGQEFLVELERFRRDTGSKSISIASHGDFINTRYDIQSYEMLRVPDIRKNAGIEVEAYDDDIMQYVEERYADQNLLEKYSERIISAFERNVPIVMSLTHPRNWKVDVWANTVENWRRLTQDIAFRL